MNEDWIEKNFYQSLVVVLLVGWAAVSATSYYKDAALAFETAEQEAACAAAALDFKGNSLCYTDSSCMITGEDFRLQLHTDAYLEEYCPDEWKTSQIPPKVTRLEEADPGLSVWSGRDDTVRW